MTFAKCPSHGHPMTESVEMHQASNVLMCPTCNALMTIRRGARHHEEVKALCASPDFARMVRNLESIIGEAFRI